MGRARQYARIEREILRYLVEHPAAKDTLAGISEWWLSAPLERSQDMVEEVIQDLVERQWMTVTELKTGGPLFGLNPGALDAIARAARQSGPEDDTAWRM